MSLEYNESELICKLNDLTPQQRTAFAALVAERLVSATAGLYAGDGRSIELELTDVLDGVWAKLVTGSAFQSSEKQVEHCTSLFPADPDSSSATGAFVEDAISAVIYALRSMHSGSTQEAAWAARRGYEAVDRYVINSEGCSTGDPHAEQQILNSPRVQLELQRQLEDLEELTSLGPIVSEQQYSRLRANARANANTFLRG
jgi:uncharacterized protein YjaG (DUF416 family)